MRIRREVFAVAKGVTDTEGQKGEPEQQPTRLQVESKMAISAGGQASTIPMYITHDAPAGEVARELAAQCSRCRFFRKRAWQQLLSECDFPTAPLMKRQAINEVRSALLMTRNAAITEPGDVDGDFDVETVMKSHMGLCEPLSNLKQDYVVVHMSGCCPEEVKNPASPVGYFQPRDRKARKEAAAVYDNVMKAASDKAPLIIDGGALKATTAAPEAGTAAALEAAKKEGP